MSDDLGIEVVGGAEAFRDVERVADAIDKAASREGARVMTTIVDRVTGAVPYLTGTLAASLGMRASAQGESTAGYDTNAAPYAGWIEFGGTRGRSYVSEGRYLFPTFTAAESLFVAASEDAADQAIRGYPWSQA